VTGGSTGLGSVPDPDHLLAVLDDTERRLDPADPESGGTVRVLGYGEVSAALTLDALPGYVCKRMSGFAGASAVAQYVALVDEYLSELRNAGIDVVPTSPIPVNRSTGHPVVYLVQPEQDAGSLGHLLLKSADDATLAAVIRRALDSVAALARHTAERSDGVEVALDGQLSNWSFPSALAPGDRGDPILFDVGTPFMRRLGSHVMQRDYLLGPVPPGIRTYYGRKGLVEAYLDDYFVPRTVALDLLGNFYKEGQSGRLPLGIDAVNDWLASADMPGPRGPTNPREVEAYYRKDADLLTLYLRLRRMDRFVRTKVLRRRYDYLLPGHVER
jgi:hypothetical protein